MGATISLGFERFSILIRGSIIRFRFSFFNYFRSFFNLEVCAGATNSPRFDCFRILIPFSKIRFPFLFVFFRFCYCFFSIVLKFSVIATISLNFECLI